MTGFHYYYVDGASLTALIDDVQCEFERRFARRLEHRGSPDTLRYVALEVLVARSREERQKIVSDLGDADEILLPSYGEGILFQHAMTPADVVTDLVCEVVVDVLRRNHDLRRKDDGSQLPAAA